MDVRVVEPGQLYAVGAGLVAGWLRNVPDGTLLAAMGTSPLGLYGELARLATAREVDLSRSRLVQLDEYLDVADDDRRSLFGWLLRDVATRLGVDEGRVLRLAGDAPDATAEAKRHDAAIESVGGLDVSVLGLGLNGHLGFNEPPSGPSAPTRVVALTEESVRSNARYWGSVDDVPRKAITVGMDRLLAARRTVLVVKGRSKRTILRRMVAGSVSDDVPASHLRGVPGAVLLADTEAWPPDVDVTATVGA